jgi:hypothetical protein
MGPEQTKRVIERAAVEINRLHATVHATSALRSTSSKALAEWKDACAQFHQRFDSLAFPGGYGTALTRIEAGDAAAIEAAICFLELRPYFFRSGYMFKTILRRMKRIPLRAEQKVRMESVLERQAQWKRLKSTPR